MPLDVFWHEELEMIGSYEKAYIRNTSFMAHQNASYIKIAFELAQSNVWGGKGKQYHEMIKYEDPIKTPTVLTKENMELKFRKLMNSNMEFIYGEKKGEIQ